MAFCLFGCFFSDQNEPAGPPPAAPAPAPLAPDGEVEDAPTRVVPLPGDLPPRSGPKRKSAHANDEGTRESLFQACEEGDLDLVKEIHEAGVPIGQMVTPDCTTPQHIAAECGHLDVVEFLARESARADLDARDKHMYTPFLLACESGNLEVVQFLATQETVNLEAKDSYGRTGLFAAVVAEHNDVVEFVLGRGGDPNTVDANGYTVFWAAAAAQNLDAMKLLASNGATVSITSDEGELASTAWEENNQEILDWLAEQQK